MCPSIVSILCYILFFFIFVCPIDIYILIFLSSRASLAIVVLCLIGVKVVVVHANVLNLGSTGGAVTA